MVRDATARRFRFSVRCRSPAVVRLIPPVPTTAQPRRLLLTAPRPPPRHPRSRSGLPAPAAAEGEGGRLRLPVAGEHALLVARDPADARRRGEVGEVPDVL